MSAGAVGERRKTCNCTVPVARDAAPLQRSSARSGSAWSERVAQKGDRRAVGRGGRLREGLRRFGGSVRVVGARAPVRPRRGEEEGVPSSLPHGGCYASRVNSGSQTDHCSVAIGNGSSLLIAMLLAPKRANAAPWGAALAGERCRRSGGVATRSVIGSVRLLLGGEGGMCWRSLEDKGKAASLTSCEDGPSVPFTPVTGPSRTPPRSRVFS